MPKITYTVAVTFEAPELVEAWLRWLREGHVAEVMAGGAIAADIVVMDAPGWNFEVRYTFPSREAFDHYETHLAPRLRAEGLECFPPARGLSYRRTVGVISDTFVSSPTPT